MKKNPFIAINAMLQNYFRRKGEEIHGGYDSNGDEVDGDDNYLESLSDLYKHGCVEMSNKPEYKNL